jgi:hypothetical protein
VVPETRSRSWLEVLRLHARTQRLKSALVGDGSPIVANVIRDPDPGPYAITEPVKHHVIVLVSDVHNATQRCGYCLRQGP